MIPIRWTPAARADLAALLDWFDEPEVAASVVARLVGSVGRLSKLPALGRPGRVLGTRELVVEPYVIAYRVKRGVLQILRVLHGARRWPESIQ